MWCIELVPCFPCQVSLKGLFPCKDIIVLALVLGIYQKVPMTKDEISGQNWRFEWPREFVKIFLNWATRRGWLSINPEFINSHTIRQIVFILQILADMKSFFHNFLIKISRRVCCEHRLLTSITLVEHHNILNVPVFQKRCVTIYLQLVSLTIVMSLVHLSGMVYILGIFMPYIFN